MVAPGRGWRVGPAPIGYRNDRESRTIVPDPEHFPLIKRMFELALSGQCSVPEIWKRAIQEWGYRTPKRKRSGGRPLGLSSLYKILANPFYAGYFVWNGNLLKGAHEPMITMSAYEALQRLLGRPGSSGRSKVLSQRPRNRAQL